MARFKHQIKVTIRPAEVIRHNNIGDYYIDKEGARCFEIGDTSFDISNLLILVHELVEYILIDHAGIPISAVDKFDKESKDDEPGDNPLAPYHEQHKTAMDVEKMICEKIGLDWDEHEKRISTAWESVRNKRIKRHLKKGK